MRPEHQTLILITAVLAITTTVIIAGPAIATWWLQQCAQILHTLGA